ncbi:MAG: hypothetical protein JXA33_07945 [Anaerolineae bacterium]|nr:hypothetical protein [Anaerolineae bacterium]
MKKNRNLSIVVGLSVCLCCVGALIARAVATRSQIARLYELTAPLDAVVIQELCQKLSLSVQDERCQSEAVVYSIDFYDDIGQPFEYGVTTYQDVQALFGAYQYECDARVITADGYAYFRCLYDFKGDRMFPVSFRFSGDNDVLDQIMPVVSDRG